MPDERALAVAPVLIFGRDSDAERLRSLVELSRVAVISSSIDEVIEAGMAALIRALDVDYAKLLRLLDGRAGLKLQWGSGWNCGSVGEAVVAPGSASQAGFTLLQSTPVVVEDFRREARFHAPALLVTHRVRSGISVTVHTHTEPFGVIGVHCRNRRRFSPSDVLFVDSVAKIISAAVTRRQTSPSLPNVQPHAGAEPLGHARVLRGWKEIATYMGSGVRTAQRWEEKYALPVHRPASRLRSCVIASTQELDAWVQNAPTRHDD